MINGKTVLAIIPARGGSKGVPRKNIREVAQKPMIAWTIEEAKNSRYIDRLIVSTDDQEIADVALKWNCEVPFLRPKELGLDDTPGIVPVLHALNALPERYDLVVLLQPTSPLRSIEDIDSCIRLITETEAKSCVSVVEPDKSPYWMYKIDDTGTLVPLFSGEWGRRQDLPQVYALNGAVYVAETDWLLSGNGLVTDKTVAYRMPKERSLDIDTESDLSYFEVVILNRRNKGNR
ncbi:cytidylyltransferase domain-containing protein [Geobacter sp.]|uniref:acylneuraminate cytidylyltransferase family protein n=1 Tax=Geobacter sp. TaxID=46610 RepID=UPI0027B88833|nr:acylneuraminate cytidylyltransferase family protein [Geobacter sp.]